MSKLPNAKPSKEPQRIDPPHSPNRVLLTAATTLILTIISLFYLSGFYKKFIGIVPNVLKSPFCEISKKNLCDRDYVELKGVVEDSTMYPGLGYTFIPENIRVQNPIYIKELRFTANKISFSGQGENVEHNIPFGSRIIIRGRVDVNDKYRCTDRDFAVKNPNVCAEDTFRILISPDAVISIPKSRTENVRFSLYGKISDFENIEENCFRKTQFCEGDKDYECYSLKLSELSCKNLKKRHNSFLLQGYGKGDLETLNPQTVFQVTGISYSSRQVTSGVEETINRYLERGTPSTFSVYNELGEKVMVNLDMN